MILFNRTAESPAILRELFFPAALGRFAGDISAIFD